MPGRSSPRANVRGLIASGGVALSKDFPALRPCIVTSDYRICQYGKTARRNCPDFGAKVAPTRLPACRKKTAHRMIPVRR